LFPARLGSVLFRAPVASRGAPVASCAHERPLFVFRAKAHTRARWCHSLDLTLGGHPRRRAACSVRDAILSPSSPPPPLACRQALVTVSVCGLRRPRAPHILSGGGTAGARTPNSVPSLARPVAPKAIVVSHSRVGGSVVDNQVHWLYHLPVRQFCGFLRRSVDSFFG